MRHCTSNNLKTEQSTAVQELPSGALHLRIRVVKRYIQPVLLYGEELWLLKTKSRLEAFKMFTLRRMLYTHSINRQSIKFRSPGTRRGVEGATEMC